MPRLLTVACIQLSSTDDVMENIAIATGMIEHAATQGATLITLPENAFLMATGERFAQQIWPQETHPAVLAMQQLAQHLQLSILIGSVMCHVPQQTRVANRSILIAPDGSIAAAYDKIHLFDVKLPSGEKHYESQRIAPGEHAVVAPMLGTQLGLSVCYDVRFPQLYRALAKAGAEILCTPAAFTRFTGEKGGWHVLNRARAMENGCFVLAPAQCGVHAGASGRQTYGHSLIIDPWGTVLAEAGEAPEVLVHTIDLDAVAATRATMPSLSHDRAFTLQPL